MSREKKLKKPVASFIFLTNIIFWPFFCLVGAVSMLGFPAWVIDVLFCISAWSSTFAFVVLFRKIYPGQRFMRFVKDTFKNKLNWIVILIAGMIQVLLFLLTLFLVSYHREAGSMFTISSYGMLIYVFVKNLFAGPLGEELGWRAFAQIELQKRHSPLKASIIIGFWWGMWHLPVWFTIGYAGMDLIKYIAFFMIALIATKIVMTAFYNVNQNLTIPILIHQLFNFFIGLINESLMELIMYSAILYSIVAVILVVINPKNVLYGKRDVKDSLHIGDTGLIAPKMPPDHLER
ncbi:CPBP family intramembrane metalloprotease [Paenibacillus alvei]|uniref:CPBP family intramembrane glutamic endopeptidase n=1 Tax=Paenibacillus TaxID=44249 RepID=UPI0002893EF8|nr:MULTISPECIES: CPBP family intramembrane glutamic endopeptidase [Paenibacillus]EJW20277.1 CAAX amino terminal protease family protein (Ste24 endopeptidase) [Paenibacillus alvei DSM 29]MCY9540210.1 CPBP family intramembrane metalloprotease [Paenibacillus alvei]MCY9705732.1 CPBP family intramembrane metalloprotease [Paenibacillus alvei]MCY9733630.1 CPBP family intramembrane metalloprotease [Paenibacillus alvei]MCY9752734.1 CPBP family intramembrane metalloprotease [Paenibacillus alvei]